MEVIENKDKIRTYLSTIKANVEMSNFSGYYDIDRELENIIAKLLNLIYGYKLVNANEKKVNFPAVDIVDDENKLAIQVTADNSYEKKIILLKYIGVQVKNYMKNMNMLNFLC